MQTITTWSGARPEALHTFEDPFGNVLAVRVYRGDAYMVDANGATPITDDYLTISMSGKNTAGFWHRLFGKAEVETVIEWPHQVAELRKVLARVRPVCAEEGQR